MYTYDEPNYYKLSFSEMDIHTLWETVAGKNVSMEEFAAEGKDYYERLKSILTDMYGDPALGDELYMTPNEIETAASRLAEFMEDEFQDPGDAD